MFIKHSILFSGISITLLLVGCGGGTTNQVLNSITPPALADGPGGRFYGYYIQSDNNVDLHSNIGGLYLSLPNSEASFSGRISYQFFDCQRTNALNISGQKTTAYLNGTSIGSLDSATIDQPNPTFSATFSGSYSRTNDNYAGTYNRIDKNGDDVKSVASCGTYTVADKGNWQVYKETQVFPTNFSITKTGDLLNWSFVANADKAVIMILDPAKINSGDNAFIRQIVTTAAPSTLNVVNSNVIRGQPYIAVVELFDVNNAPVAFETLAVTF